VNQESTTPIRKSKRKRKMKHTINKYMAVTLAVGMIAASAVFAAGPKGDSIVDVAIALNSNGDFKGEFDTLIAAVLAADPAVLATLDGNGQHTVFAPTDDAFAAIELSTNNIAELDQGFLTDVLLYHVAKGNRDSAQVTDSSRIRTLAGETLLQDGGILTDNLDREAEIIVLDVPAANGVIHAIDAVVLPYLPE
jgi:uncharacterized surface protein with fasciclin (FAS1) repeats